MRTLFGVGLVFLCLGLAGCSLFGKKNASPDGSSRNGSGNGDIARTDPPIETGGPNPGANGLLAGQVQDIDRRGRAGVFIQIVDLKDSRRDGVKSIEVEADKNGYFTIQGLELGHHYQLIARVKDGDRILSGSAVVTPPNPRMAIVISEDYTSSTTPGIPKPTPLPERSKGPKTGGPAATIQPPRAEEDPGFKGPAESNINVKDPSKIATEGAGDRWPKSPPADMRYVPPPKPTPTPSNDEDPLLPRVGPGADGRPRDPSPGLVPTALTPVPSCQLVGNTLRNFALYDLDGQAWEYKRDHRGRLTLLDFWFSTCPPCIETIRLHLVPWQKTYGPNGLEIVGIAYEQRGDREEQAKNVLATRGRYSINYTTLLGSQKNCPVAEQFQVKGYPTLVLLDENGQIVWRGTGSDPKQLAELEFEIRKGLKIRP